MPEVNLLIALDSKPFEIQSITDTIQKEILYDPVQNYVRRVKQLLRNWLKAHQKGFK